ncbi:MAG TPA: hypothetical protein VLB27_06305, partial [candidate division Zixibacteria bacterium]|nr:hypothetical protein [candidate division Zixibacteria bacterium]
MYSKPSKSIAFTLCAIVVAVGVYYVGFDPQFDSIASKQESAEVQSPEALAITPGEAGDPAALDWCSEHAVPESQCTQCNPALIDSFKASGDWCGGHGIPESHCRLCNPEIEFPQEITLRALRETEETGSIEVSLLSRPNEAVCATNDAVITLAGSTTAERIGLQTVMVTTAELRPTMSAPAEVVFDEEHSVVVSISAPALVTRWLVSAGEFVERDDILAYV